MEQDIKEYVDVLAKLKELESQLSQSKSCPSCGYCPHCGRGGHQTVPYYPTYPYPWYQPFTWTNDTMTISNTDNLIKLDGQVD